MPIVTISRGTFSGGMELAELIAERRKSECISREVITEAADSYGVTAEDVAGAMDRPPSLLNRLSGNTQRYVAFVRAALCEHALSGNLVYHGMAGHLLLAGVSHVVRVRVLADMEYRTGAVIQRLGMVRKEAVGYIHKVDKERAKWTRFVYGVEGADPSLYDLVVNLEHTAMNTACECVCALAKAKEFQPTDESRKAMGDLALSSRVTAKLAMDEGTMPADLNVVADDGAVTVEGKVRLDRDLYTIRDLVAQIDGVTDVTVHLVTHDDAMASSS